MSIKIIILIFTIFTAPTCASFFDEFRGAMWSVEDSFGKLLTDVVTDVRDTIGCTILAVKQVLALGGIFHESSDYDARCVKVGEAPSYIQETEYNYEPTTPAIFTKTPTYDKESNEKSFVQDISKHIDESIKNVNATMFEVIDKNDAREEIESVKISLEHESSRLSAISALLRRELASISEDVRKELRKVESDFNHPTIQGILNDIRALHKIELSHSNSRQAAEIRHILDEILRVLRGIDSQNGRMKDSENEMDSNNAFAEIERQFLNMKEERSEDASIVSDLVADIVESKENILKPNEFPLTFKDVALKIMDETSRTLEFADKSSHEYEDLSVQTTAEPTLVTENLDEIIMESPDYSLFFEVAPKGSETHREVSVIEAQKLIEKSKQTEAVINDYFKKSSSIGTSVFDNPDLLEFAW